MKPQVISPISDSRGKVWLAASLIAVAGVIAYHNAFDAPFVFDDALSIADNPTIRRLGSFDIFRPPTGSGLTVQGRPLLNASFALNYALSGTAVASYHALNLAIHIMAALALFGVVHRTLRRSARVPPAVRAAALPLGAVTALLWLVHPLQTESVTYVVQRAESLMGMFFLLTLYGFARGVDGGGPRWFALALIAVYCGAATKEVTAAAPLIVLLYDRTFVAGSFRAAWRERGRIHLALMSCWLLIAILVIRAGNRGGTVGFGSQVGWGTYVLTQFEALAHYVRLSFWPAPLIFDYGAQWVEHATDVFPSIIVVLALGLGSLLALRRWPEWGFLGVWFFAPLAPTSLIPGNRQTIAEHRLYLSLAALIVAAAVIVYLLLRTRGAVVRIAVAGLAGCSLGWLTISRNFDYRTELALYRDTVAKRPHNGFARYNLGKSLAESGAPAEAVREYEAARRLMPDLVVVHYNLGNALTELGRWPQAVAAYEAALRVAPTHALSHYNLGNVLVRLGRRAEAREHFAAAVRWAPELMEAHVNFGGVLLDLGELDAARAEFEHVLATTPSSALAHLNLGNVHLLAGRLADARREFERALQLEPKLAAAQEALARVAASPNPGGRP